MMLDEALLGPAPEPLHAVDIHLAGREILTVVHLQMPVSAEHETVIALEFVRVNHRSPADLLDREPQKGFRRDIGNDTHMDQAVSFQDAEDRNLPGGASSPVAFSPAAEVGLIQLDFSSQEVFGIFSMAQDTHADGVHGAVGGLIRHFHLPGHLVDRYFKFKELDERQPLNTAQAPMIDPAAGEGTEGVKASGATISSVF